MLDSSCMQGGHERDERERGVVASLACLRSRIEITTLSAVSLHRITGPKITMDIHHDRTATAVGACFGTHESTACQHLSGNTSSKQHIRSTTTTNKSFLCHQRPKRISIYVVQRYALGVQCAWHCNSIKTFAASSSKRSSSPFTSISRSRKSSTPMPACPDSRAVRALASLVTGKLRMVVTCD